MKETNKTKYCYWSHENIWRKHISEFICCVKLAALSVSTSTPKCIFSSLSRYQESSIYCELIWNMQSKYNFVFINKYIAVSNLKPPRKFLDTALIHTSVKIFWLVIQIFIIYVILIICIFKAIKNLITMIPIMLAYRVIGVIPNKTILNVNKLDRLYNIFFIIYA